MEEKEEYKKSLELWVQSQELYLSSLIEQASAYEKSIFLDTKALELKREMIDFESERLSKANKQLSQL